MVWSAIGWLNNWFNNSGRDNRLSRFTPSISLSLPPLSLVSVPNLEFVLISHLHTHSL